MNTREILIAARSMIAKPENWTQGCAARDASGAPVAVLSRDAACWCVIGALGAVVPLDASILVFAEAARALRKFARENLSEWNDSSTHEEIIRRFDQAIKDWEGTV